MHRLHYFRTVTIGASLMADDKIYFDEQALSIVDTWLTGNTGNGKDNDNKSSKSSNRVDSSSIIAPASKVGLGFKGKVLAEKEKKDALQVRLEKSKKEKKKKNGEEADDEATVVKGSVSSKDDNKNDSDDDDDEGMQLHGVVEDMPISRTQKSIKPVALLKKQPKRKSELINGNLVCEKKDVSNPILIAPIESTSKTSALSSSGTPGAEIDYKRKRTKTRSKQKNIRRDNRPDSQKPSYITDMQSEDYRGRYLTEVRILIPF